MSPAWSRPTPRHLAWLTAHGLVWIVAACIVGWAVQATAPSPLWHWQAARNPFLVIDRQEIDLAALETPQGQVTLTPQWHGLPPHVQPNLTEKHRFEAMEEQLIAWTGQPLAWIDTDGQRWPIAWQPMGWKGIPTISWMLLLTSVLSWHVAMWNLAQNPRDNTTRLYVIAGVSFTVGNLIRAWLSARPWGLPTLAWDFQFIVSHTCGLAFLGCLLLMVLRIPRPVISKPMQWGVIGTIATIELSDAMHWVPDRLMATYQWPMAGLAMLVLLAQAGMAWHCRHDPAYRAALRWIGLVFAMAVIPPAVLYAAWATGFIHTNLYDPVLVAPTLGYFAFSALLHRDRLLRLESWRSRTTSFWITGLITLGLMITLLVRGDDWMGWALGVTAMAFPWLYLAVRAVLTYRTPPTAPERLQALMPDVMTITVSQAGREALADAWVALLQKAFRPESAITVHTSDDPTTEHAPAGPTDDAVRISRDGSLLHVPHLPRGEVQLQRRQPFTPTDRELAEALWRLTSHGLITKDSYEAGVKRERRRIAADLHDSIGGRLLHLSQTAASTQQRQYAINTLADLRNITRGLSKEGAAWSQVLADLRHQVQRELDAVDVDLHWACDWPAEALAQFADGEEAVALHCVASELVRNALQHAQPDRLSMHWGTTAQGHRELRVQHGGTVSEPSLWSAGLGVNSIRRRFLDRQGQCEWALVGGELVFTGQWPPKADQP
ncbi:hypothetical protein EYS42_15220 [Aquabacterium lacunae]|uniref:Signal transduction histidine kinase subgroup 3 dimerisation and phosphoacceptor domain-containing protein n=1 Tax=Aquabacterium lacunae TaxID=2528630 RepID=A0A4Q9GV94_9BURK|nr:hypothetical protein [Aquabacterium lacunae]TBO28354.1 hypothetical protein EYS42_15220 [Aquabacterium lacunae]